MLKTFGPALLLACGLAITAGPALALQTVVTQVDKNTDGSVTYHFAVKLDQGETLAPGEAKATAWPRMGGGCAARELHPQLRNVWSTSRRAAWCQ